MLFKKQFQPKILSCQILVDSSPAQPSRTLGAVLWRGWSSFSVWMTKSQVIVELTADSWRYRVKSEHVLTECVGPRQAFIMETGAFLGNPRLRQSASELTSSTQMIAFPNLIFICKGIKIKLGLTYIRGRPLT